MPFYSESTKTITFRIVYDGLGTAGKTTNVQQLHELYAMRRESDVIVPEVVRGRTAYFDWLELATGTLDDRYALRCQVVTVPGQFAYAPRRWKLLKEPDAVVCVCDSSTGGVRRARLGLDFLRELRARGVCPDVPFVIQANKRDLSDAVPIVDLRAALGLDPEETVTEAVASTGEGVQLTFYRVLDRARTSGTSSPIAIPRRSPRPRRRTISSRRSATSSKARPTKRTRSSMRSPRPIASARTIRRSTGRNDGCSAAAARNVLRWGARP